MFRFSEILYPSKCVFCGRLLRANERGTCRRCAGQLPYVTEPVCGRCGKPLEDARTELCDNCRRMPDMALDQSVALWVYRPSTKAAMMDFKYGGCMKDAAYYADELAKRFHDRIREWDPTWIVPVPIHRSRARYRGYNQAELLAEELGERVRIPVRELLRRTRGTLPQKTMDPEGRRKNLRQVFAVEGVREVRESRPGILLVDDIYTTGATLDACARVLKDAGADRVYGICVCIGSGY